MVDYHHANTPATATTNQPSEPDHQDNTTNQPIEPDHQDATTSQPELHADQLTLQSAHAKLDRILSILTNQLKANYL